MMIIRWIKYIVNQLESYSFNIGRHFILYIINTLIIIAITCHYADIQTERIAQINKTNLKQSRHIVKMEDNIKKQNNVITKKQKLLRKKNNIIKLREDRIKYLEEELIKMQNIELFLVLTVNILVD